MRHNGLVRGQVDRGAELLIALLRHARAFWLFQRWFTFRPDRTVTLFPDAGWKYLSSGAWTDDLDEVVERATRINYW